MKIEYVREFKKNYLVIEDENVLNNNYETKMLTKNTIDGLLSCNDRMINGSGYLYYDISSKQNFKTLNDERSLSIEDIKGLFSSLIKLCSCMEKYLMYEDGLMLKPEYIYKSLDSNEYYFLYYQDEGNRGSFTELLDYLIEHIDSDDISAVEAVYQMSDLVRRSHYAIDESLKWFDEEYIKSEKYDYNDDNNMKVSNENDNKTEEDYEEWEKELYKEEAKDHAKNSLFKRILSIFIKKEKAPEIIDYAYENTVFEDVEVKQDYKDNSNTVFIPWVENCEHKLYGLGKNNKKHIDLNRAPITIGKLKGAVDIEIPDESISRIHAKLIKKNGKYVLVDMNSTNGTYKNGLRLSPNESVVIEPGDEIGLGKLKFIYR